MEDNNSQGSPKKINLSLFSGAPENLAEFSWESNNSLTSNSENTNENNKRSYL